MGGGGGGGRGGGGGGCSRGSDEETEMVRRVDRSGLDVSTGERRRGDVETGRISW